MYKVFLFHRSGTAVDDTARIAIAPFSLSAIEIVKNVIDSPCACVGVRSDYRKRKEDYRGLHIE